MKSGPTRTVWFNCCAGVAGDMLLASLIDAGADQLDVMDAWAALGLGGYAATWERVQRCGVGATWTNIAVDGDHDGDDHHDEDDDEDDRDRDEQVEHEDHGNDAPAGAAHAHRPNGAPAGAAHAHRPNDAPAGAAHAHRPAREVLALIAGASLPAWVGDAATRVYRALAEVEGRIHGMHPDDVELHEVGALDSILDVVGVCAALHSLGIEHIVYSPVAVGHGTVSTAHGQLPNPVPAVSLLLADAEARIVGIDTTMELSTPTGVAILTTLGACGPMPSMNVAATGFGAGTADPPGRPNVVQAVVGTSVGAATVDTTGRPATLVEVNVDDVTGEVIAHTIAQLLEAGAHDAWATPIVMKKGRPAHTMSALCDDASFAQVREVMVRETGSLGVRASAVARWPQHRDERTVHIDGHAIRVKIGEHRVKAEFDDALAAASSLDRPVRDVLAAAESLAESGIPR
jgi:uncharacterized protein (TIGR00299 family) protein